MSLPEAGRQTLRHIAKASIQYSLEHGSDAGYERTLRLADFAQELQQPRASFVTLHINDELRGCIGTLEARQPLIIDVAHNARAAAFHDPRFAPLSQSEFDRLQIHISILGIPEAISFSSEQDLIRQLRPGIDGLILAAAGRRGTFLPSVWESLPAPEEFLAHLKMKAGLPTSYWPDDIKIARYTTESF
ncbi:MAG: AmmeMemoRadiSam system protein A [Gammaproteobacteria bacterium]|nr:AmmeMemoRadiSam system protein A [Gammaproteobacteria bacterium]